MAFPLKNGDCLKTCCQLQDPILSGLIWVQSSQLFAKIISRQHNLLLAGKELKCPSEFKPVTPSRVSTALAQSCLIFQCAVRSPEIFSVKKSLSWRSYSGHGLATELATVFIRTSCWWFSALSRFNCASVVLTINVCTALSRHSNCTDGMLKAQWHLKARHTISMQMPRTTTVFAQQPLCASLELPLHCRGP